MGMLKFTLAFSLLGLLIVSTGRCQASADTGSLRSDVSVLSASKGVNLSALDSLTPEQQAIYDAQKKAMEEIGAALNGEGVRYAPLLLNFLDYPSSSFHFGKAPQGGAYLEEALDTWPAFKALYRLGLPASDVLVKGIGNKNEDLRTRLTLLQVLNEISPDKARTAGDALKRESLVSGQPGAADRVDLILSKTLRFWGFIKFAPVSMSKEQILSLLSEAKHIANAQDVVEKEVIQSNSFPAHKAAPEYRLILQQIKAMHDAGELKIKGMTLQLVAYIDYVNPGSNLSFNASAFTDSNAIRARRPAVDAMMKINDLDGIKSYISGNHLLRRRVSCLSVLRDIDYPAALLLGNQLLQSTEVKRDPDVEQWISMLLEKDLSPQKMMVPATKQDTEVKAKTLPK